MLSEMVLLGVIARRLYKRELPKSAESNNNIEQVCVISTHVSTIENIMKGTIQCTTPTHNINNNNNNSSKLKLSSVF